MKNVLIVVALGFIAWLAYTRIVDRSTADSSQTAVPELGTSDQQFSCDGRTHCSQMTSCAEAEFFLQNCPGVEMDGNNDGEPCERQWCGDTR